MKVNEYVDELDKVHSERVEERKSMKTIEEKTRSILNELSFYESFIPNFFSANGDAQNIRKIYKDLKENVCMSESVVETVDINIASHCYEEYSTGMNTFINDVIGYANANKTMTESEQIADYENKITKASSNDGLFIESLFGGINNGKQTMKISEAMCTLETMVDFIPQLSSYKNQCTMFSERAKESEVCENTLVSNVLNMYYESISNYCNSTIKSIISSYSDINNALYTKKVEKPEFRIFG